MYHGLVDDSSIQFISCGYSFRSSIKSQMNIWHLLTHCAGLSYSLDNNDIFEPADKSCNDYKVNISLKSFMASKESVDNIGVIFISTKSAPIHQSP